MAQYLDNAGLQELVKKTKEYARKSAKDAVNASAAGQGKTITGWSTETSAAIYSDIAITSAQVTDLANAMALKANLESPVFSGTPTVPYPTNVADGSLEIANVDYVLDVVGNIGEAMHYKGAVDSTHPLPTSGVAGDTWKVAASGTYAGHVCEVGDMIIANKGFNTAPTSSDVDVIQTNIDGAVTSPATAVSGNIAMFDNANGRVIADGGIAVADLKTKQEAYSASGEISEYHVKTVTNISQNENGEIQVEYEDIPEADTDQYGLVKIETDLDDPSEERVPTGSQVHDFVETVIGRYNEALWETGYPTGSPDHEPLEDKFEAIETSAANLDAKIDEVSGAIATSAALLDAKITAVSGAVDNIIEGLDADVDSTGGVNVSANIVETDGKITSLTLVDNTQTAITDAINALDVPAITSAASATITSISETDGKIAATYSPISITSGQVSNLGQTLSDLIGSLDVTASAIPPSGTITSISETDGKIAITSAAISISASQVNDLSAITTSEIDSLFTEV